MTRPAAERRPGSPAPCGARHASRAAPRDADQRGRRQPDGRDTPAAAASAARSGAPTNRSGRSEASRLAVSNGCPAATCSTTPGCARAKSASASAWVRSMCRDGQSRRPCRPARRPARRPERRHRAAAPDARERRPARGSPARRCRPARPTGRGGDRREPAPRRRQPDRHAAAQQLHPVRRFQPDAERAGRIRVEADAEPRPPGARERRRAGAGGQHVQRRARDRPAAPPPRPPSPGRRQQVDHVLAVGRVRLAPATAAPGTAVSKPVAAMRERNPSVRTTSTGMPSSPLSSSAAVRGVVAVDRHHRRRHDEDGPRTMAAMQRQHGARHRRPPTP